MTSPSDPTVKILVVDDQEDHQLLCERWLHPLGQTIVKASSGEEAWKLAERDDFAVILLDVNMPGIDGLETARRIRACARSRSTPIVFITAYQGEGTLEYQSYDIGAVDFLNKPIEPVVLKAKVRVFVELAQKGVLLKRQEERTRQAELRVLEGKLAAKDRLLEAEKLKAAGALASGVAHHINNLLQVILGNAALATRTLPPESRARGPIDTVSRTARRAGDVVGRIMALGSGCEPPSEPLAVNDVIGETIVAVRPMVPEVVRVESRLDPGAGRVSLSRANLDQALLALMDNAIEAMPDGGTLTIETGKVRVETGNEAPSGCGSGSMCRLAVSDTGTGMDGTTLAHVFEPFFTTKAAEQGVGLGLYTVRSIVEQAGGTIHIESVPQKGTTVRILLPCVGGPLISPEPPSTEPRPQESTRPREYKGTVLVVEDEEGVRALVCNVLEDEGYRVFTAGSAEEAIGRYRAELDRLDLMLTDVVLPGLSGPSLARRFVEQCRDLRVLYMTAHPEILDQRKFSIVDYNTVLRKPFTIDDLVAAVQKMIQAPPANG